MSDFPDDAERLPEGFKRIAYDSDSAKFTFRDRNGQLYQGEAGAEYGILTPILSASSSRPSAFSSDSSSMPPPRRSTQSNQSEGKTFEDILPSNLITSTTPTLSPSTASPLKTPIKTVRKTLYNIRRSVTSIRRSSPKFPDKLRESERDETRGLIRRGSSSESSSIARRSKTMPTRPRSKYPPS